MKENARMRDLERAIEECAELRPREAAGRTFLEISGYAHYENVWSNVLAFFLDPEETHGFGTLFLSALLDPSDAEEVELSCAEVESVEREVPTDGGNRIDIIVSCRKHLVAIENKVFAAARNPFREYSSYVVDRAKKSGRKPLLYYLYLRTPDGAGLADFKPIGYAAYLNRLRDQLGRYAADTTSDYLVFALHFMRTIENLLKGSVMQERELDLLKKHEKALSEVLTLVRKFRGALRNKVNALRGLVDCSQTKHDVAQRPFRDPERLRDVLAHDIRVEERFVVVVDACISASGWHIDMFVRGRVHEGTEGLKQFLSDVGIEYREDPEGGVLKHRREFDYGDRIEEVAEVVRDLVERIGNADI